MFEQLSQRLLRVLRVPPQPEPPFGAPGSVRVFRAGRNFYRLRIWGWAIGQVFALAGLLFSLFLVGQFLRSQPGFSPGGADGVETREVKRQPRYPEKVVSLLASRTPGFFFGLIRLAEGLAVLGFLAQLPISYALLRLDYEQRWYVVTDRSLRLRSGLWEVSEITMSFANLQQITVSQGPLQRLFSLADVKVQSAGGGVAPGQHGVGSSMHTGLFHGVDNAGEIRDLIVERLRQFRESGLGDPDEKPRPPTAPDPATADGSLRAAAQELLDEARALRGVLG